MPAPLARVSNGRLQCFTPPGLCELAGVCVSAACSEKQRPVTVFIPPGLRELAGVCVSTACYEKQRLLRVLHRQGSVSWRVCVSAPFAPKSSDCSGFATARAPGAGGCGCQRRVLSRRSGCSGFLTPPGLRELAGVCVSAACSEEQAVTSFHTARAL